MAYDKTWRSYISLFENSYSLVCVDNTTIHFYASQLKQKKIVFVQEYYEYQ